MFRILLAIVFAAFLAAPAQAQPISVDAIMAEAAFYSPSISPDGSTIVGIRHTAERDDLISFNRQTRQAVVLLSAHARVDERLSWVRWKSNARLVVGVTAIVRQNMAGRTGTRLDRGERNEFTVSRVVAMNADGGNRAVMFENQQRRLASNLASTRLVDILPNDPENILLSAYGQSGYSLWQANVSTGQVVQVGEGDWETTGWVTDVSGAPVMRAQALPRNAGMLFQRRVGRNWVTVFEQRSGAQVNLPDYEFFAPGPDPGTVWIGVRANRERAALHLYNVASGEIGELRYENPRADLSVILTAPETNALLAACANVERIECQYFDAVLGRHFRAVSQFFGDAAEVALIDMSDDQNTWLLFVEGPAIAPAYYTYDRTHTRVDIVAAQTGIAEAQLSPTETFAYQTRDGVDLWGYLTVPRSAPAAGAPMVVMPHGGPELRDNYGYDPRVQFLASRGYLVFQPQFRGSGGFGRAFQEAGRGQWGQRIQDDVTDGVQALIAAGRADAQRICIVGGSYGGYAALAGGALTPELYRCVVSINGISDLDQFLRAERTEQGLRSIGFDYWQRSIGNIETDRARIAQASPSNQAASIQAPVLLLHGEDDLTVSIVQSEIMDRAMRAAGKSVRFVRFPDSGHNSYSWEPEHQRTLYQELDTFLATHLAPR